MSVSVLDKIGVATSAQPLAGAGRAAAPVSRKADPYVEFEGFVLQSFVQSMLPKEATSVFGEGTAGDVWKSMLAEKIGQQLAETGGIGIARMLAEADARAGRSVPQEMSRASETSLTGAMTVPPMSGGLDAARGSGALSEDADTGGERT